MRKTPERWTIEDLIDFEHEAAAAPRTDARVHTAVISATRGLEGAAARSTGLKVWLDHTRKNSPGRKFTGSLGLVSTGLCLFTFLSGASAVLGLLDREKGGVNVTLFIVLLLGIQWGVLLLAGLGWLIRHRAAGGFSAFQALLAQLAGKASGPDGMRWWQSLMDGGGGPRKALLWRLARQAQAVGIFFNLGILAGLAGLVLVRHVGFFWETTTTDAMRAALRAGVDALSFPWGAWFPAAVPGESVILASRWLPGQGGNLAPGPAAWWMFLLMAISFWGLCPRLVLWFLAVKGERDALKSMDFQGRQHRALWRSITGTTRSENDTALLDGVLVLDVGGSGISPQALRPFFLRQLRVHPAAWKTVAVFEEEDPAEALAKAPAGVVLLAEGWSLSPPRMVALHSQIRAAAGVEVTIKFLAVNVSAEGVPAEVTAEEKREWERFVDSLRDPMAEVYFYQSPQDGL